MNNQNNRAENPLEEVDAMSAPKDVVSPPPAYQDGGNDDPPETQMGQDDSDDLGSRQYE